MRKSVLMALLIALIALSSGDFSWAAYSAKTISQGNVASYCWSPDGAKLAFVRATTTKYVGELCVVNADGTSLTVLTAKARTYASGIDWRGDWILFVKQENTAGSTTGDSEVYKIKSDGTGLTRLTFTHTNGIQTINMSQYQGTVEGSIFFLSDSKIVFKAHDGNGWFKVYTCNADGTDGYVTISSGSSWAVGAIPATGKVLYSSSSNWNQPYTLYISNSDGSGAVTLASGVTMPCPAMAANPSGSKILYENGSFTAADIVSVNSDGTGTNNILGSAENDQIRTYPAFFNQMLFNPNGIWSTDGNKFMFSRQASSDWHVWEINADGSGINQVTTASGLQVIPTYASAGGKIACLHISSAPSADTFQTGVFDLVVLSVASSTSTYPEMASINAGTFMMGSIDGDTTATADEKPRHQVTISNNYYMGKYEVTNAQYCSFLNDTGNSDHYNSSMLISNSGGTYTPSSGKENHPVVYVSSDDAVHYCLWLSAKTGENYSLPTEAQWEYACRAGTTTLYSYGSTIDSTKANFYYNFGTTTPVGQFPANAWGLYDMHGNVWEWCADWYSATYYSSSPATDPTGPSTGTYRVYRGGSWNNYPLGLRASDRVSGSSEARWDSVGFRVVKNTGTTPPPVSSYPEMASINAGTFTMGSPSTDTSAEADEKPQHQVTLSAFEIGKYEVTNIQFCAFLNDGNSSHFYSGMKIGLSGSTYTPTTGYENHPVIYVSWNSAKAYCDWLSTKTGETYRLPTEAEWEYACRAGTTTKYYWGDTFDSSKANNNGTGTVAVGSFPANPWGLYDMNGNISEWCSDWYNENYYSSSSASNPTGPTSGLYKVYRGDAWDSSSPDYRRSANRNGNGTTPDYRNYPHGFRVAKASVTPPPPVSNYPEMVSVNGGTFTMGGADSDSDATANEKPQHQVTISKSFQMSKYEITNDQYCAFLNDGNGSRFYASMSISLSSGVYTSVSGKGNYPVVYVTWDDAKAYCDWLSTKTGETYRLPTEAEWEYACRAGTTTKYYWGDTLDATKANYNFSINAPKPVGSYPANSWGLYDMSGNVEEWCADWYGNYSAGAVTDPTGPASGTTKILRGGGFDDSNHYIRCAGRSSTNADNRNYGFGIRVVKETMSTPPSTNYTVSINSSAKTVGIGSTLQLSASTSPTISETYTWASSNSTVATVSNSGLVTGVAKGSAIITAFGNTSKASGAFSVTVEATSGGTLTFKTFSLPDAKVGVSYVAVLDATGGTLPYVYELAEGSLPTGIALSPTGTISGTATVDGAYSIVVKVTDANGATASVKLSFYVSLGATSIKVASTMFTGYVGEPFDQQIVVVGGRPPYTLMAGFSFPVPGLTMSSSGRISGTPTQVFDGNVSIIVQDLIGNECTGTIRMSIVQPADNLTCKLFANTTIFEVGKTLELSAYVRGSAAVDVYVAKVSPNGNFNCMYGYNWGPDNVPLMLVSNWTVLPNTYSVMKYKFTETDAAGDHTFYAIFAKTGSNPMDIANWMAWGSVTVTLSPFKSITGLPNVSITMPDSSIDAGDQLVIDMDLTGSLDTDSYDTYLAIVFPGDWMQFICMTDDVSAGSVDSPSPYVYKWVPGEGKTRILQKDIPNGWKKGKYTCFVILVNKGADPQNPDNWLKSSQVDFDVNFE